MSANALRARRNLTGYLFILPNFLGFVLFTSAPVVASLSLAFMEWDILTEPRFVGLEHFRRLLGEQVFWYYLYNTLFLMLGIPLTMAMSLFIAIVLNQKLRGVVLFRTMFFLPSITSGVAIYILWAMIYNPEFGLLNGLLELVGIEGPRWLGPGLAKPSLILMGVWIGMGGFNMILYLAGLQNIDPTLYEAAEMDGASAWTKFRHITWPLLSPTTFFIFITSCIGGLQGGFEQVYIMTGGGPHTPLGETTTLGYHIYMNAYEYLRMGYASAVAWFLFLFVFVVTMVNWKYGGRHVEYH